MKTRVELAKAGIELLKARDENTESFNDREISYDEWAAKDASFAKKMAGWRRSYISYKSKTTGASCDEISIAYASTITERIIREIQY